MCLGSVEGLDYFPATAGVVLLGEDKAGTDLLSLGEFNKHALNKISLRDTSFLL